MLDKVKSADPQDRNDSDESADLPESEVLAKPQRGLLGRLAPQRLTSRIVVLNLLGLVILVIGIEYFNQFRQGLIDARVQSLTTQAHIIAAAIAGSATVDTGSIVIDPDSLAVPPDDGTSDSDQLSSLDFPINPETAGPILKRLLNNTTVRARIIDPDGNMVVDSRFLYGRGDIVQTDLPPLNSRNENFLTRWWDRAFSWLFAYDYPMLVDYGLDNGKDFPEVKAALSGASVSLVRLNDRHQIVVLVSVPVQRFRAVLGALVLSTTGGEIDDVLRAERRVVFYTFGFVALVTILLSVSLASTIAEPIRRLSAAAERVRQGINKRVEIPDFTTRRDEIGHLSGAIRDMTTALYNRIDAIEAFAADVSHELKNPLTSLRSAVETLAFVKTDEQRSRLVEIVKHDVKRLDRLITDISDASRLDAELARAEQGPLDLAKLLSAIVSLANETRKEHQAEIDFEMAKLPAGADPLRGYVVLGHESRLGQVARNLLDNARSFTAPGTRLIVRIRRVGPDVEFRIDDRGPGIRPDNLERIFERFYTDRPEVSFGSNSGLGLSISKQIVEAHKGRIWAENRYGKASAGGERPILGARFLVRIPAVSDDWTPPTPPDEILVHGTCVMVGEVGVLILGTPGSGKSGLALRLIDQPGFGISGGIKKARLVADDQVAVRREDDRLVASAPLVIAGKLEIRGLGLVAAAHQSEAVLGLAIRLAPFGAIERHPELSASRYEALGLGLPLVQVDPALASAPACVRAAVDWLAAT